MRVMRECDDQSNLRHFRTAERYFCQNGQWWYSTREGEEGPFPSREAAEFAMQRYVDSVNAMRGYKEKHDAKFAKKADQTVDHSIWNQQIDTL